MATGIQYMKLTDKESALVAKVVSEGHTELELEKTAGKFKVGYRYKGGFSSYGGQSIIYDLKTSWMETIDNIQSLEAELYRQRHPNQAIFEQSK